VLIHLVALIYFLLLGATRKMESARRHGLSKLQALAAMGTISVLAIGGMTNWYTNPAGPMVALYLLVIAGLILVSLTTPTLLEYVIGLRRARKEGEAGPSVWSDSAPNRPIVAALCGVLLATASILGTGMDDSPAARGEPTRASFPLAVAVGCLTVAYYGLAAQYFQIRFGRRGPSFLGLFLFVAWGLPMVLGVIILASMGPGGAEASTTMVFSASPIVGLAAAGGVMEEQAGPGPAGVAITLALLYTFSFSRLYTTAVRRRRLGVELLDAQRDEVDADFAEPDAETKPKPAPAVG